MADHLDRTSGWSVGGTLRGVTETAREGIGWTRVTLTVGGATGPTDAAAEFGAAVLWGAGAAGVEERDSAEDDGLVLLGGFADPADAARAVARAAELGLVASMEPITDDGLDAWREWAVAERAGRFWITPPWVEAPAIGAGEQILWIDPGRTFGSGSHPTTRLVLALLDDLVSPGATVLDVGCGSGVLAIGAALCGAATAVATDIDPASPGVVAANADRNQVAHLVRTTTDPVAVLAARGERYDLVLANLLAPVIAELGADLVRSTAPGGALVISGLLADRWEAALPAVAPLAARRVASEDGWVAVLLR
ncbi:MAG: Ribosomal protein methyltransferase [Ilumatobacteraceae bacterium]|nr:Ribosomal protein methyltransferase [Ilumatobacteraceae bacterium]